MRNIYILIPSYDLDETEKYYRDVLMFKYEDNHLLIPESHKEISLKPRALEKSIAQWPPQLHFPIFNFKIKKNFLSYMEDIYNNGAKIEALFSTPGGYYARIIDPSWNKFEVECDSFDDIKPDIDPSKWKFYFRY